MNDFLNFRKMITPIFIQAIFWIGVLGMIVAALFMMSQSFLTGLVMLVVGPLVVRMYCELFILFFKIHEELVAMRQTITGSSPGGFPVTPMASVAPGAMPVAPPQY